MAVPRAPKSAPMTAGREAPAPRLPERDIAPEPMRPLDPNRPILSRSGKPVGLTLTGDEDKFDLQRMGIFPPAGWDYQWKVRYVKGREEREMMVEYAQNGWEPVPASRHDGLCMPKGYEGDIERGGQVLMERDERLTIQARANEKRSADRALAQSHVMASLMGPNSLAEFDNPEARRNTGVSVKRESAPVAPQKYQYSVDE